MSVPPFLSTPLARSASLPFAANGVLYGTWAARIPEIQERAGLSEGELGLALLGLAVGLVVSASMAGPLVSRLGPHRVTLAALVAFASVVVGPGLAAGFWGLAGVLVLVGLASGLLDVSMNAWAADVEGALEAEVLGACHGMFSLGGMVGAGLGALAAAQDVPLALHFGASGVLFAGGALVQGVAVAASRPAFEARAAEDGGPLVALPVGPVAGLALLAFCGLIVEGAMADWGAVFLSEALGASPSVAALGFAAFLGVHGRRPLRVGRADGAVRERAAGARRGGRRDGRARAVRRGAGRGGRRGGVRARGAGAGRRGAVAVPGGLEGAGAGPGRRDRSGHEHGATSASWRGRRRWGSWPRRRGCGPRSACWSGSRWRSASAPGGRSPERGGSGLEGEVALDPGGSDVVAVRGQA